ncbi:MAG: hypothetical protein Q9208_004043 [Pyrenodesmia sp. 3 TL-2023]
MPLLSRRAAYNALSIFSLSGAAAYYTYRISNPPRPPNKKMLPSYEATFSVPLECDACVTDIKSALSKIDGKRPHSISSTSFSIPSRLVTITSTSPPSQIINTIQSTGRDAILRGSGQPNSAAVCILELPPSSSSSSSSNPTIPSNDPLLQPSSKPKPKHESPVRGLARLIQLSDQLTLLDLTLTNLPRGRYRVSVRKTGDISAGSASLGPVYNGGDDDDTAGGGSKREGELGVIEVDEKGRGNLVGEVGWRVGELVGRGMCVRREGGGDMDGVGEEAEREVVGVVARSAGVWENEKVVCGCSGKTVWEERQEMVGKGML